MPSKATASMGTPPRTPASPTTSTAMGTPSNNVTPLSTPQRPPREEMCPAAPRKAPRPSSGDAADSSSSSKAPMSPPQLDQESNNTSTKLTPRRLFLQEGDN